MHYENTLLSRDANPTILHTGKKYAALLKASSKQRARNNLKRSSNSVLKLHSLTLRAQREHAPTNAITAHDAAEKTASATSTAHVDQLGLSTSDSPVSYQDTPRRTVTPTSEPQKLTSTKTNRGTRRDYTTTTGCQRHIYLLTTVESPRTKDFNDPLHQWWHDSDSCADSGNSTQTGAHTEYYDLCSAHNAQGVLPSSNSASSHHRALLSAVSCHYDDARSSTRLATSDDHQQASSASENQSQTFRLDSAQDADSTTSELHSVSHDATSADDLRVDALPSSERSRVDKQSQTLWTSSGSPRGRPIVAEHLTTLTHPNKQEHYEIPSSSDPCCLDIAAVKTRLINSFAKLDECISCLLLDFSTTSQD
jgi:hypothetical protein